MDVVSPELNSLLPDEIMDTEAIDDVADPQPNVNMVKSEPNEDTSVPMETDTPMAPENVSTSTEHTLNTSIEPSLNISSGSQLPITISTAFSPLLTLKPALSTSTATTKTTDSLTGTSVSTSGLQKLNAPFTISAANHQIILNKLASSQATEAAKTAGAPSQVIKQEGQKLLLTAIGKSGQPIVLQLPHTVGKPGVTQTPGDIKYHAPQFKVVTIGGRSELKPLVGSTGNQVTTLQAQQLCKTVQVTFIGYMNITI